MSEMHIELIVFLAIVVVEGVSCESAGLLIAVRVGVACRVDVAVEDCEVSVGSVLVALSDGSSSSAASEVRFSCVRFCAAVACRCI